MRIKVVVASVLVLSLSIVSTTFVLLALTSNDWSRQDYYSAGLSADSTVNASDLNTVVCTGTRSPFYRCNTPRVYINNTCVIPDCLWYKPYGANSTSCRTARQFGVTPSSDSYANVSGLLGSSQECQDVHYAGNLQIAASFFIVLALCFALVLSVYSILAGLFSRGHGQDVAEDPDLREAEKLPSVTARGGHSDTRENRSRATPYIVAIMLAFLYIGALMQILAQFFGVLGLTILASPGADVTRPENQDLPPREWYWNFTAESWVIGKALSTYATVAWTSALLSAAIATTVFRTPRTPKLI